MIVIHKKRIQIMALGLLIGICAFAIQTGKKEEKENTVPTTATPVSGKTIVVDAGHGKPDERCRK